MLCAFPRRVLDHFFSNEAINPHIYYNQVENTALNCRKTETFSKKAHFWDSWNAWNAGPYYFAMTPCENILKLAGLQTSYHFIHPKMIHPKTTISIQHLSVDLHLMGEYDFDLCNDVCIESTPNLRCNPGKWVGLGTRITGCLKMFHVILVMTIESWERGSFNVYKAIYSFLQKSTRKKVVQENPLRHTCMQKNYLPSILPCLFSVKYIQCSMDIIHHEHELSSFEPKISIFCTSSLNVTKNLVVTIMLAALVMWPKYLPKKMWFLSPVKSPLLGVFLHF